MSNEDEEYMDSIVRDEHSFNEKRQPVEVKFKGGKRRMTDALA